MGNVEFEIGDGSSSDAADDRPRAERRQSTSPWFVLLAVLLIGAGSGLALQTELPVFAYEQDSEGNFIIENADGGVITWSWRGDQDPDDRTIGRINASLTAQTRESEWYCLFTDEANRRPAPDPMTDLDGVIMCYASSNCLEEMEEAPPPRTPCGYTIAWLPPEGWEWPTDSATAAN